MRQESVSGDHGWMVLIALSRNGQIRGPDVPQLNSTLTRHVRAWGLSTLIRSVIQEE